MIEISAIISTYNRAHFLPGLFKSILNQNIVPERYELVIVNNNSTDDTESICARFIQEHPDFNVTYCVETKQGLSYGRNRGITESTGDFVTFLDDDAIIAPDFLEETIRFFRRKPFVNAIGGKILLKYLDQKPSWYNPFLASLLGYFNYGDKEKIFQRNYFRGSNMSFRRSLFEREEGFNTSLGRVGKQLYGNEEKELFYRLKEAGEEMWYVPSAIVYHLVPRERTLPEFVKKQAIGTGQSQRQQAVIKGRISLAVCFVLELIKWGISFILALFYILTLHLPVAGMLLKFRWWVSLGMLKMKK